MTRLTAADAVAALRRWEDAGAVWRVLERTATRTTVELWTCTGDEVVDRIETGGHTLDGFLAGRRSSMDPPAPGTRP